ncbi:MAG: TerC/Alx family metal homeostasis membrane protein [Chlorobi bacterium]|nr:TerC/Alx family metal homeostasis membrane protein [Chlorobiota bacterium]
MFNLPEIEFFLVFLVGIFFILLLDLGVFRKQDHVIGFTEALIWSAFWILLSIGFYFFILHYGNMIHGITTKEEILQRIADYHHNISIDHLDFPDAIKIYDKNLALEYITAYFIEKSLSVDNIFVMIVIFSSFGIPSKYHMRVLVWGIIGAVIMRFIFIFSGAALVHKFNWILYVFGAFLVFTGIKLFFNKEGEEKIDTVNHPVVRFTSRFFNIYKGKAGHRFFIRKDHKFYITPLFVVLLVIEFSDVVFAVDSIPAIFAISRDPYIIFFSNIFAILGLRALFFLLSSVLRKFHYLQIGLSVLLTVIGLKMLFAHWLKEIGFTTMHSFYLIIGILGTSILASIILPPKEPKTKN